MTARVICELYKEFKVHLDLPKSSPLTLEAHIWFANSPRPLVGRLSQLQPNRFFFFQLTSLEDFQTHNDVLIVKFSHRSMTKFPSLVLSLHGLSFIKKENETES